MRRLTSRPRFMGQALFAPYFLTEIENLEPGSGEPAPLLGRLTVALGILEAAATSSSRVATEHEPEKGWSSNWSPLRVVGTRDRARRTRNQMPLGIRAVPRMGVQLAEIRRAVPIG